MPSILNLKFKGNKSFVAFSNLGDVESLTKTWKVCTKVASYLEQGQRLENLSWRLWHLQNLMVDTDNAKSKREFKKLSKCMGDKLDKEKGRSIEELEAPDFRRNPSTDMIRQRAVEKERNREASQNAQPGTIKRMQFTFSVDQPTPVSSQPVKKPDLKPSPEFNKRPRGGVRGSTGADIKADDQMVVVADEDANDKDPPLTQRGRRSHNFDSTSISFTLESSNDNHNVSQSLRFPPLFSNDFGPTALLYPSPTLTTRMNYGEGLGPSNHSNNDHDGFSIPRPTIELPLDELLNGVDSPRPWSPTFFASSSLSENQNGNDEEHNDNSSNSPASNNNNNNPQGTPDTATFYLPNTNSNYLQNNDVVMQSVPITTVSGSTFGQIGGGSFDTSDADDSSAADVDSDDEGSDSVDLMSTTTLSSVPPISNASPQPVKEFSSKPAALPSKGNLAASRATSFAGARSNTPRPHLTVRTSGGSVSGRTSSVPGATATSLNSSVLKSGGGAASLNNNSAPGGQKAECSNCGATHTPLWRRGLNDELNCNACGLYCKLHKRPRPKTMRNTHGEGRTQSTPRQETVEVMAQCYNCHTTATPLWRKDDEGKTVCNACGLYYKLHGSARPISMKSDVIRKRSRHDARRAANGALAETPSASPGVSRRASPARESSPTLAPDSSTVTPQLNYDYGGISSAEESDYHQGTQSELLGALGPDTAQNNNSTGGGNSGANSANATGASNASLYQNVFSFQFPGPYHPDHLYQHSFTSMDPLPFASVDLDVDLSMSPRTTKRRRMSTDSASEPPSSAVSYSSYTDGYSTTSSATSHSQRSSISLSSEFPFSTFPSASTPTSYVPNQVFRGSAANAFWHPPMMMQDNNNDAHGFHPPMILPSSGSEDSPMDYLHPPLMQSHDDDALFSTYLHPPMILPDESGSNGNGSNSGSNERSGSNNNGNNNHYYVSQDYGSDMRIY